MQIKNQIAIVTGASAGLGRAISQTLVKKGATVYGLARNADKLHKLQQELGKLFKPVTIDLCDEIAIRDWVTSTFHENYSPQILINNAGTSQFADVDQLSAADWHAMINTNLNAVHFMTAAVVPLMKKQTEVSYIVQIGSILGKVSGSQKSAYSATKFAIQGYSEALFKELRGFNIKVTCLNPGSINTDFFKNSGIIKNDHMLQPNEIADVITFLLETPDNVLIDELTLRPLRPKP